MGLDARIHDDLRTAMRLGQTERRDALRLLLAEIKNERIESLRQALEKEQATRGRELTDAEATAVSRGRGDEPSDEDVLGVVLRLAKRHRQSIEEFQRAHRDDLVAHEEAQLAVIQGYLPEQMGAEEIAVHVRAAIEASRARSRKDMGKVMGRLSELRGKADMAEVSRAVQSFLGE